MAGCIISIHAMGTQTAIASGVVESGDHFTKFSTIYQWFQTLIHPALMQRLPSQIFNAKADYVLALKGNHPTL